MKNAISNGQFIDVVLGATAKSGDPLLIGGLLAVLATDGAIDDKVAGAISGVYSIAKETPLAITQGARLYWDNTAKKLTTTKTANPAGWAWEAAGANDPTVKCLLDPDTGQEKAELSAPFNEFNVLAAAADRVTNTNVETDFATTESVPANSLKVGDMLEIEALVVAPDNNAADTLALKLFFAGVQVSALAAFDAADGDVCSLKATIRVTSVGAGGKFDAIGWGSKKATAAEGFGTVQGALNTTVAAVVKASATWSAAHADNQADLRQLSVRHIQHAV